MDLIEFTVEKVEIKEPEGKVIPFVERVTPRASMIVINNDLNKQLISV